MTTEQITEQAPAAPPLNRAELAEQVAYYRALAAEAKIRADQYEAGFESAIGDEYRREKTAPTWRVPDLVTISGRVKHGAARLSSAADFLAWVKAHRPEDVETIERVVPVVAGAILKGCHVNPEGLIVTASGDEVAGIEWVPGGAYDGVSFKFEPTAKAAYAELARTALDALSLRPAEAEQPVAAAPFAPAEVSNPWDATPANPWDAPAPDPWATPAP